MCLLVAPLLAPEAIAAITAGVATASLLAAKYGPNIVRFLQRTAATERVASVAAKVEHGATTTSAASQSALARPVYVIGETTARVEAFAARVQAETYVEADAMRALGLAERAARNLEALAAKMNQGYAIYDLGLDPDRRLRGFFYFVESGLMNASQYPYWVQIRGPQ